MTRERQIPIDTLEPVEGPVADGRRRRSHREAMADLYAGSGLAVPEGDPASRKTLVAAVAEETIAAAAHLEPALRDDQVGFLEALARHAGDRRTAPVASTVQPGASGKTTLMMRLVKAATEHPGTATDGRRRPPRVVLLAPTRVILRQISEAARRLGIDALFVNVDDERGVGIATAMTHARFAAMAEDGRIGPEDVDLLVVDEVHRMLSERRVAVLDRFLGRTYVVAATASPTFSARKGMDLVLGEANRVWSVTNARMRAIGAISTVTNVIVGVRITGPMPEERDERALVRRQAISEAFVELVTEGCPGFDRDLLGLTFLFYAQDVSHARMTADLYDLACVGRPGRDGFRCRPICGYDERDHVVSTIRDLEEGLLTGISNVLLLGEGYDLPRIRVVANAPTGSPVRQTQQSARAQRVDRADPEGGSHCTVIDFHVEENGELHGRPRWFYEVIGEADKAERPLVYSYDTRADHADLAPYRGLALTRERSIDGAQDCGLTALSKRSEPAIMPMPDFTGALRVDWSVDDVVELGRGIRRRISDKCEDEVDAAGCTALAALHGVPRAAVTSSYRILARAIAEDAAGTSLCGLRLRPVLRRSGNRTVVCLDLGEAEQLVAALADEGDERTRTLEDSTYVSGRFMRTLYSVPDPDVEKDFLEDVRIAARLGRTLELRDGAILETRLARHPSADGKGTAGSEEMTVALFPRAAAARVADHLGLVTRTWVEETPPRADEITLRGWRALRVGADADATRLWRRLADAMREGDGACVTRAGGSVHVLVPRLALTARGAEIVVPRDAAEALAGAIAAGVRRRRSRTDAENRARPVAATTESGIATGAGDRRRTLSHLWIGDHLPREDRPVDTRARLAHFTAHLRRRFDEGRTCILAGRRIEATRVGDGPGSDADLTVSSADATALLQAMGLTPDARRFLDRDEIARRTGTSPAPAVWNDLAAQWRDAGEAVLGGVRLRGNAGRREGPDGSGLSAGGASVPPAELHPDDLGMLGAALIAGV